MPLILGISELTQCFVKHDADGVCEVQAADIFVRHRHGETMIGISLQNRCGQAPGFASENEAIAVRKFPIDVRTIRFRREIQKSRPRQALVQPFKIDMPVQIDVFPVIQPGPFQRPVVHPKTGHAHDMQTRKCCRAQTCDVAGIRRNLRFDKSNMKHSRSEPGAVAPGFLERGRSNLYIKTDLPTAQRPQTIINCEASKFTVDSSINP